MKTWNGSDDAAAPIKPRRSRTCRTTLSATFVTLVCLAAVDTISPAFKKWPLSLFAGDRAVSHAPAFDWDEISASEHLQFHKCFNDFECAKLKLPLDYFNGTYPDHTVSIAITKVPAVVPVSDPRYGGPILLNPGGPGGAGAGFALVAGKAMQQIVDSDDPPSIASPNAKYFDIIGFDPRGIGWTEPVAQCMPDQPSVWSWDLRESNEGLPGSSDASIGRLWSMMHAFGASCKLAEQEQDGPDIKQYMSTASVARDMLEIAERHTEYVAKEAGQIAAKKAGKRLASHHAAYVPGESKLQYWGFSYGTYLGSTFASMFPDRVGRLILDGVVSEHDYNHSLGNGSLVDAEKVLSSFYTFCFNAGPTQCPLATANSSVTDIEERVQKIVKSLYHDPLPIISNSGPDFLTWSDVKMLVISSLYLPRSLFPFIAGILADIEAGGGSQLDALAQAYRSTHVYSCPVDGAPEPNLLASHIVTTISVLCGEGDDQSSLTKDEFNKYWEMLESVSPTVGAYWSTIRMRCAGWNIRAKHRFNGSFGANTSNPILFISNTADPVTPLRSGRYMSSLFPGSGLLISDHAGHCTLSTTDVCVWQHIKTYFQSGKLPAPGALCVPPSDPFSLNSTNPDSPFYDPSLDDARSVQVRDSDMDAKQRHLHDAGVRLQKDIADSGVLEMNMHGGERMKRMVRFAMKSRDERV
ncbi:uncharacterized protein yc1106_04534 [Curvularia clavata]|uniref:Peptidase S33 tripeptidyl aminopeptidase-like C-terminal domain-containing protein n=1 Tax=Curvularia clavata TaxID=95742 RepID=A0A9Q9DSR0_CURCL|nr:uncharacterized protein yc1106_04534 [Curvularia clavata]